MVKQAENLRIKSRNIFIFLLCFLLSAFFWFFLVLRKEYKSTVRYTVHYINLPGDKVLTASLPSVFLVELQSTGFNLMRYKFNAGIHPLIIDLNVRVPRQMIKNDHVVFYHTTNFVKEQIVRQLKGDKRVLSVQPDTLFFSYQELALRKVPVSLDLLIVYQKQYYVKDKIVIDPDSIMISGPENIISQVAVVETQNISLTNIKSDQQFTVALKPIENIRFQTERVRVTIPVEQFTETSFTVPVEPEKVPDSIQLKLFPSEVLVRCMVGLSRFKSIRATDFGACIDYAQVQEKKSKLDVILYKTPSNITAIKIHPPRLEYIIEVK